MYQSHIIDISGTFAGAAVSAFGKFRFIAVDPRVADLDQSEWQSLGDVKRVVGHLLTHGHLPPAPEAALTS
jgi:hypothetical protein